MGNISFSVTGVDKLSKALLSRASAGDIKSVVKRNTTQMQQQAMSLLQAYLQRGIQPAIQRKALVFHSRIAV